MATKIRPIVFKVNEPEGFVMNASNATIINNYSANWEGPNYPDGYNGNGKTLQIIVKEEGFTCYGLRLQYCNSIGINGPAFIDCNNDIWVNPNDNGIGTASIPVGTYNLSIVNNSAGSDYGKYIGLWRLGPVTTLDSTLLSKIEFRIID